MKTIKNTIKSIALLAVLAVALGDTACGKVHYPQGDQKNQPSQPTSPPGDWPMTEYEKEQTKKAVEVLDLLRLWEYDSLVNPNNRRIVAEYARMSKLTCFIIHPDAVLTWSTYRKEIDNLYTSLKKLPFDNEAAREKAMQDFVTVMSLVVKRIEDNSKEQQSDIKEFKKKMKSKKCKKDTVVYDTLKQRLDIAQSKVKENKDTVKYIRKLQVEISENGK